MAIADAGDFYIQVYDPGRNAVGMVDRMLSMTCKALEFRTGSLELIAPHDAAFMQVSYSGSTGYARELSGYGFDVYYRGIVFFSGVCYAMEDEDAEEGSSTDDIPINVKIICETWEDWFLGGRVIMGSGGARHSEAAKRPDNILKSLWRANLTGTAVTPADYATVYDPLTASTFAVDRADVGNGWTIAVAADTTSHPDTVTHRWDSGRRSLADSSREFARRYNLGISGSWSGTTYTLTTSYPATGTDRAATVKFDREGGGLLSFRRIVNRKEQSTVIGVHGKGRYGGQVIKYAGYEAAYDDVGARETGDTVYSADATEAENESRFVMVQEAGAKTRYEARLAETGSVVWGDFALGDKITIYDSRRGITVADWISGAELSLTSPGPVDLTLITGREPVNTDQQHSRGGGGGGGGRKGGGGTKDPNGAPEVDPDDIVAFVTINTQSGAAVADVVDDTLTIEGLDTSVYVRAQTSATDDPEVVKIGIVGDFVATDIVADGHVKIKSSTGTDIWLLATDNPPATP